MKRRAVCSVLAFANIGTILLLSLGGCSTEPNSPSKISRVDVVSELSPSDSVYVVFVPDLSAGWGEFNFLAQVPRAWKSTRTLLVSKDSMVSLTDHPSFETPLGTVHFTAKLNDSSVDKVLDAELIELGLMERVERQVNDDALVTLDIIGLQGEVPGDVMGQWRSGERTVGLRIPLPIAKLTSDDVDSLLGLLESITTETGK